MGIGVCVHDLTEICHWSEKIKSFKICSVYCVNCILQHSGIIYSYTECLEMYQICRNSVH